MLGMEITPGKVTAKPGYSDRWQGHFPFHVKNTSTFQKIEMHVPMRVKDRRNFRDPRI